VTKIVKILFFGSIVFAISCNPTRRAERLADKAIRIDRAAVVRKVIPSIVTETRVVRDSSKLTEFVRVREEIMSRADSFRNGDSGIDCEGLRAKLVRANEFIDGLKSLLDNMPIITDTIYRADTGRIWLAENNVKVLNGDIMAEKNKRIRDLRIALLFFAVAVGLFAYVLLRKK
jgi:hypothetical protein